MARCDIAADALGKYYADALCATPWLSVWPACASRVWVPHGPDTSTMLGFVVAAPGSCGSFQRPGSVYILPN